MVLPRLALAAVAAVAVAAAVHVGTAAPAPGPTPAGLAVAARPAPRTAQELYGLHCAQCHGEKGDGNGPTELERPARSFVEGGYIYGNTVAAVTRTLREGIRGTAMPSFADSLSDHERSLLARYVLDLGPEGTAPSAEECLVAAATDRSVTLDGLLLVPASGAVAPSRLVLLSDGPSLQYLKEDWSLAAIRARGPVVRDDWRRGGRSLIARGEVLWGASADAGVRPDGLVASADGPPLGRRLRRTAVTSDGLTHDFEVVGARGPAQLTERVRTERVDGEPVVVRTLELSGSDAVAFAPAAPEAPGLTVVEAGPRTRVVLHHPGRRDLGEAAATLVRRALDRARGPASGE